MNRLLLYAILGFALPLVGFGESLGVVLRFDDTQPVGRWQDLIEVFDAEGVKASLAIPSGAVRPDQAEFLRRVQAQGHELMDHTHDHAIYSHFCCDEREFTQVCALPIAAMSNAALRIVGFRFCFNREHPGNFTFKGFVTNGILVVSKTDAKRLCRPNKIYIPSCGRYFGFFDSPDGRIALKSFYTYQIAEEIDVLPCEMLSCDHRAFSIADDVVRFQATCSQRAFREFGLRPPRVWIQPGGWDAWLPADQVRRIYGREFGYVAADCVPSSSSDWNGDPRALDPELARYCFRPEPYFDDATISPKAVREKILAAQTKGCGICFLSHMVVPLTMKGGWAEWMSETRALLRWLKERKISVRTFVEMSEMLWETKKNR